MYRPRPPARVHDHGRHRVARTGHRAQGRRRPCWFRRSAAGVSMTQRALEITTSQPGDAERVADQPFRQWQRSALSGV